MVSIAGFDGLKLIGAGANARVFSGRDLDHDREVAVKVIQPGIDLEVVQRRFNRERKSLGRLSQVAHIVDLYQSGFTDEGEPYLVMPKLEASLQDVVDAGGMSWENSASLIHKVAGAISAAHELGILHLDLKPDNILLDAAGSPQVADFGIAEFVGSTASRSGAMLTPDYSAPERFDDAAPDKSMDVYALGACLFALLAGTPPFSDENTTGPGSVMRRILDEAVPLEKIPNDCPQPIVSLIARSLAKNPEDRPLSAELFRSELEQALNGSTVEVAGRLSSGDTLNLEDLTPAPEQASSRALVGAGIAVAALLAIIGGFILSSPDNDQTEPSIAVAGVTEEQADATTTTSLASDSEPAVVRARTLTINDGVQTSIQTTLLQSGGSRVELVDGDPRGELKPNGEYFHARESDAAYTFSFAVDELASNGAKLARWNIRVTVASARDVVLDECPSLEIIDLSAEVESSSVVVVTWGTNTPATELVRSQAAGADGRFSNPSGNFYEDFTHRLGDLAWSGVAPLTAGTDYDLSVTLTSQCDPTDSITEVISFTTAE